MDRIKTVYYTHHSMRLGPSSGLGATFLNLSLSSPIVSIALPAFLGSCLAMNCLMAAANLGPFPLVLTMICSGPSR